MLLHQRPTAMRDHLRVCRADNTVEQLIHDLNGSPPRVRSRRVGRAGHGVAHGITSACAEQTFEAVGPCIFAGDHLRVCGADLTMPPWLISAPGSPPRVRSRRQRQLPPAFRSGITSACAEQTTPHL